MKKIIKSAILLSLVCALLCGCDNTNKVGIDEKLKGFNMRYCVNKDVADSAYFYVSIDFEKDDYAMSVEKTNGKEMAYAICDIEKLQDYLIELVSHPDNNKKDSLMESPPRKIIWDFELETDKTRYYETGFDDYPGYWDELWEVLIETTDAENLEDFGFGDTDKYELNLEYTITEQTLLQTTDEYTKDIKYPQLVNVDDYYEETNKLIVDSINEFDVFDREDEYFEDLHMNYSGEYEITQQSEETISIKFVISSFAQGLPHPTEYCYGLTADLETGKAVTLDKKIPLFVLLVDAVTAGKYTAEYGVFTQMSRGEIRDEIKNAVNEEDFSSYKYNFYMVNDKVHLIVNDVIASDYAIISYDF